MAIVFRKKEKIQRNLILVFIVLVLITAFVVWLGFFRRDMEIARERPIILPEREIKIDFEVLNLPILEKLQPFPEIEPFKEIISAEEEIEQRIGRENPFVPY